MCIRDRTNGPATIQQKSVSLKLTAAKFSREHVIILNDRYKGMNSIPHPNEQANSSSKTLILGDNRIRSFFGPTNQPILATGHYKLMEYTQFKKNIFSPCLSLVGNSSGLTWVRRSSRESSVTRSYQCVQYFPVSKQWYVCQCVQYFPVSKQWYVCQCVQYFPVSKQWYVCQCVQYFPVSRQWYVCQWLGFLTAVDACSCMWLYRNHKRICTGS